MKSLFLKLGIIASIIGMAMATIMTPNQVYSQATVTAKQTCTGNQVHLTIIASGFPRGGDPTQYGPRGVILVDGKLAVEQQFSASGTITTTWSGSGPIFGPGRHRVIAFHDANENRQLDSGELQASTAFTSITCHHP
jgi:hypothetical protein